MINKINNLNLNNFNFRVNKVVEFSKFLENQQPVKFSGHAIDRLKQRNIILDKNDLEKINEAIKKLKEKGGRESLIIYNNIAFITSVRNNTIITAIDSGNLKENVFTNIDSAIIL
ncbi:flagellar operon protein [Caloramator fervidus]|uniref:Flagellar operon protein n=1 Tax=Caloramator fervidus TaxID=29344 RepID=A0A1H5SCE7_9CLOT|nr:TIGR02530 family flagellar biosynthesis protein [Caloramator fervidus]SEF48205.1 flagellar operon protein [Caloramator fervidus]